MRKFLGLIVCAVALSACVDVPARLFEVPTADGGSAEVAPLDGGGDGSGEAGAGLDAVVDGMLDGMLDSAADGMLDGLLDGALDGGGDGGFDAAFDAEASDLGADGMIVGPPCGADGVYFQGFAGCLIVETAAVRLGSRRAGHTMTRMGSRDEFALVGGNRGIVVPPDDAEPDALAAQQVIAESLAFAGGLPRVTPMLGLMRERFGHSAVWIEASQPRSLIAAPAHLLVVGGRYHFAGVPRNGAVVWDPAIGMWRGGPPQLLEAHAEGAAAAMRDGFAIIVGGVQQNEPGVLILADAERYRMHPAGPDAWNATARTDPDFRPGPAEMPRTFGHTLVPLSDGMMMWGGGYTVAGALSGAWTLYSGGPRPPPPDHVAPPLPAGPAVAGAAAVTLGDPVSDVMLFGGVMRGEPSAASHRYEVGTRVWTDRISGASSARVGHTATRIGPGARGFVVIVGGAGDGAVELVDGGDLGSLPTWRGEAAAGPLAVARRAHTAARLSDGRVVIAGGLIGEVPSDEIVLLTLVLTNNVNANLR